MDKLLAHIDIAQEDGTQNPDAANVRIKAKTNGSVVTRSGAGVEAALGGSLSVLSAVIAADLAGSQTTDGIPGLSFIVPAGKSAFLTYVGSHGNTTVTGSTGTFGVVVNNPAGSNGNVIITACGRSAGSAAASATGLFTGNSTSVGPNSITKVLVATGVNSTSSTAFGVLYNCQIFNLSQSSITVQPYATFSSTSGTNTRAFTSIFALIS